jgi:hypothetical protein
MTGGVALFVLDRLVETGRINADEIRQLVESLPDEIRAIERRLERLRVSESRTEGMPSPVRQRKGARTRGARRSTNGKRPAVGGKALGGTYGGLIRRVPKREQAAYLKIKNERGIEVAIRALRARNRP